MYGRGLRSIRTRFTLLVSGSCLVGIGTVLLIDPLHRFAGPDEVFSAAIVALLVLLPGALTFFLAGKLVADIRALKVSAEAIVAGDMNHHLEVDCRCEVGGLADSFRKMVDRLNSNLLRMNILAYHDSVTGFTNRTVVQHVLTKSLDRSTPPLPMTMLFIDLDGFKTINDTLGHEAGDELLRQVSHRIVEDGLGRSRSAVDDCTTAYGELCDRPPQDIVFSRFAGDEFVAILPGLTDVAEIGTICNRIQACLQRPFEIGSDVAHVGASIGVARAPLDARNAAEMLADADMAMYAAKERGRGRTVFFDAQLRERLMDRQTLEQELRVALETDQFVVHYQPKYDIGTRAITGYEALVRWQHPTRGILTPGHFLEIAEKNQMMCDLGGIVLKKVFAQLKAWQQAGQNLPVAVNISPSQFRNPQLIDRIKAMIEANRIDPRMLEIEITEQAAMDDYASAAPKLEKLRALGTRIAMDDFGVGYSNLTNLVSLPIDELKIDKSLVDNIGRVARSEIVIESLVHLAHRMGQTTVAEGIERPEQIEFLKRVGCDHAQGFLLARPQPAESLPLVRTEHDSSKERFVA